MGTENERFHDDLRSEWDLHGMGELVLVWVILTFMWVNRLRVMRVCIEEMQLGREMWKERYC